MTQELTIRNGKIDDKLVIKTFGERDPKWALNEGLVDLAFADDSFHVYIAETTNAIVGYGLMRIEGGSSTDAMIYVVYVPGNFRRQGFGTALMNYMLHVASKSNCKMIRLMVDVNNTSAYALYKNLGFVERRVEMHLNLEGR